MNKTHLRTYANTIRAALVNRREALKMELAVMFAVVIESEGNKRLAREAIYQVYNSTGSYQCAVPSDRDWKAVGRQISAGLALYDFIGAEEVASWADGYKHGELIQAFADRIAPLKLGTVNEILTVCEKVKKPRNRIDGHIVPEGAFEVRTEHVSFYIPPDVRAEEVMTVINKLMGYANTLLDANKGEQRKAA